MFQGRGRHANEHEPADDQWPKQNEMREKKKKKSGWREIKNTSARLQPLHVAWLNNDWQECTSAQGSSKCTCRMLPKTSDQQTLWDWGVHQIQPTWLRRRRAEIDSGTSCHIMLHVCSGSVCFVLGPLRDTRAIFNYVGTIIYNLWKHLPSGADRAPATPPYIWIDMISHVWPVFTTHHCSVSLRYELFFCL